MPTMGSFLKKGAYADGQRHADPGAAQYRRRLVLAGDRRLARRPRLDQQYVPHRRPADRPTGRPPSIRASSRPRRSPSPPSAAASRSPRWSGPVAGTPRSTARPSTSGPSSRAAASPRTSSGRSASPCSTTPRSSPASDCSSTTRRATPGRPPFPAAAPTPATGWTGALPQTFSPAMEMRLRVLDFGVDKYGLNA